MLAFLFVCLQIQINSNVHTCASRRVLNRMASQEWIVERGVPLLKDKPQMGARELKEELEKKYMININYQTC